jgi:hypothetical protein
LDWNYWIRQIHRWLSIAFTVAVIVNLIALGRQESALWIGLLALLPLVLLLLTGLYLFVLLMLTSGAAGEVPKSNGERQWSARRSREVEGSPRLNS